MKKNMFKKELENYSFNFLNSEYLVWRTLLTLVMESFRLNVWSLSFHFLNSEFLVWRTLLTYGGF